MTYNYTFKTYIANGREYYDLEGSVREVMLIAVVIFGLDGVICRTD